jgi:hypothetical protein
MPILPILCLLGAFFIVQLAQTLARVAGARLARSSTGRVPAGAGTHGPAWIGAALLALLAAVSLAQGIVHSIHSGLVLSRADTRNVTRGWMLAHIPLGAPIVAEPVSPNEWANETRPGTSTAANRQLWNKYPSLLARISPSGALAPNDLRKVSIEEYERTLAPALIGYYLSHGYCWVLSGSTQSGRAFADPTAVPQAIAYYRALGDQGQVVYRASPYARGQGGRAPVPFGFDWSFDYYPLAYDRPGPEITIYRLHGGRCGV